MSKIQVELQKDLDQDPGTKYAVLITTKGNQLPKIMSTGRATELMPGIYQMSLTKKQIQALNKNKAIVAIEKDTEMGI
jgi:hypothetical protein